MRHVALLIETSRAYGRGLLNGIARYNFEKNNWWVHFQPYGLFEPVPSWFMKWHGDGILARIDNPQIAEAVMAHNAPVIDLRNMLDLGFPPFGASNTEVAEMAFEHFQERGIRNFAFYGEPSGTYRYDDQRCSEFQKKVAEVGRECHVYHYTKRSREALNWDLRLEGLGEWIRDLPKPVGILGCHDGQGQELLDACRATEIVVPNEVAVLGVDNDPYICGLSIPPLSSIDLNTDRIGYEAAATLDKMMDDPNFSLGEMLFSPRIVATRQSTDLLAIDDPDIVAAIRFIREKACSGITVEDVTRTVLLSRSTLNRQFKALVNQSPKAMILRTQLEFARQYLVETDLAVAVVSERCGFSKAKYFHEVFHRRVGVTPREFRLANRQPRSPAASHLPEDPAP
jgi:LacI family transcriptional regulator